MFPHKFILPLVAFMLFLLAVGGYFLVVRNQRPDGQKQTVSTYDDCVALGNPVMESYPPQCRTEDGQLFTQNIGNEMERMDTIIIENPRPNQLVTSPLTIKGRARGIYFFEASFPIRLVDDAGKELARSFVEAQSDWMTEDFVPFLGEIEFTTTAKTGTLYLQKSNPSGLPQNDMVLEVPVRFR